VTEATEIVRAAALLAGCRKLTVVTGAGVSSASGVPTFRGTGGLWKTFRPEDLATAEAFTRDPKLVWEWYQWRRSLIAGCRPNRAHDVLADWSRRFNRFSLVTQNIDGLHERAGTPDVIRFHGSIWEVRCSRLCPGSPAGWVDDTHEFERLPPQCPYCGGILRPGVVWFGEAIPDAAIVRSRMAADCDVCLVVGTSSMVYPAAAISAAAAATGAYTIEVNPESTPVSAHLDLSIRMRAEDALDRIERVMTGS
jgi:NAD-dependent deacetylase